MKLALCVGVNDYSGTGSDLAGCVNDAHDWGEELTRRGYEVKTLLDRDASAKAILEALKAMMVRLTYGDIGVFQFSGHGSYVSDLDGDERDGRDEVICPSDIMGGWYISDDQIHAAFRSSATGSRVVFISDSCHSGTVHRFRGYMTPEELSSIAGLASVGDVPRSRVRFLPPGVWNPRMLASASPTAAPPRPSGRTRSAAWSSLLLSGCQDWEYSYDAWFSDRANGAFSRAALDHLIALRGIGSRDPLNYTDWYKGIRDRLPTREHPQTPAIQGERYMRAWPALEDGR